jgi:hypothetical protein
VWSALRNNISVFSVGSVPRGYERIRERELTSLEFRSSEGTAMWPEEELEGLVCGATDAAVTVIFRELELIVVTTSEDPINRSTNPNPRLSH